MEESILAQEMPNGMTLRGQLNSWDVALENALESIDDMEPGAAKACIAWVHDEIRALTLTKGERK